MGRRSVALAAISAAVGIAYGCATGDGGGAAAAGGASAAAGADASSGGAGTGGIGVDAPNADQELTPDAACALATAEAKQLPAAFLFVLDRSSSMAQAGKWPAAQLAIVQAIDFNAFDNISLGLNVFPAGDVPGPACIFGFSVSCGVSALPQVPLADSTTQKSSDPSGVRGKIYNWLSQNQPNGTATPGYDALKAAIASLQMYAVQGPRLLMLLSDGGFGCTSLSNPLRPNFEDAFGCPDWEHPDNVVQLLAQARNHATAPVLSFIVGVPGSDTHAGEPDAPPFSMRRALSAFAAAGSPHTPAGCDGAFTQAGGDPTLACHFDLTQGNFDAQSLSQTITEIRGKALGCVYELPASIDGQVVDKQKVNVKVSTDGGPTKTVLKRSVSSDTCETDGCWDYNVDETQINLIGKTCNDVTQSPIAKVEILVGCKTEVK
jgi:hypothetical protein